MTMEEKEFEKTKDLINELKINMIFKIKLKEIKSQFWVRN